MPENTHEAPRAASRGLLYRVVLLFACVGAGSLIGYVGFRLTGGTAWFLAVPACVVAGWFAVADPTKCVPAPPERPKDGK